jgi:hypothetical protein
VDKKKKQLILIGCLLPVLGLVIYNSLSTVADEKKKKIPPKTTETQTVPPVEVPGAVSGNKSDSGKLPVLNKKLAQMQKAIADEAWGRDPFRAPIVKDDDVLSTSWKDFKLTGVIPGRTATINGEIIGVGEEFEGYRLIGVENYRIILEKAELSYILTMPED